MKLLVLSDLHVEFADFEPDREAAEAADVVVLAGDIHQGTAGMGWARQTFPDKPIIYVAGNHEFYGQHWDSLLVDLSESAAACGIHFLENDVVVIEGVRFLGATLWTDFEFFGASRRSQMMRIAEQSLNDYRLIEAGLPPEDLESVYEPEPRLSVTHSDNRPFVARLTAAHSLKRHQESLAWLKSELLQGDPEKTVVVTHHYPHRNSTHPKWANDPLTAIFGSKLPNEILTGATLWIHGHAHDSCDYRIAVGKRAVRVVSNPRGYPLGYRTGPFENSAFDPGFLVEIDSEVIA